MVVRSCEQSSALIDPSLGTHVTYETNCCVSQVVRCCNYNKLTKIIKRIHYVLFNDAMVIPSIIPRSSLHITMGRRGGGGE